VYGLIANEKPEWVSGDVAVTAQWDFGITDDVAYHKVSRQTQQAFAEVKDRAEWGNFVRFIQP
jgi:hypothetical protein